MASFYGQIDVADCLSRARDEPQVTCGAANLGQTETIETAVVWVGSVS